MIQDLGSKNGTFVNGVPVGRCGLRPGDTLTVADLVLRVIEPMSDQSPAVGEFAAAFVEFMQRMSEAAETPEPVLLGRIREHLGAEPGELPVTSAGFGVAERPNLQLALDAVLPDRETIGLASPHMGPMDSGFKQLFMRWGPGPRSGVVPVEYVDVELGDGRVVRCIASALLLSSFRGDPVALVITSGERPPMGHMRVSVEGIAPGEGRISELLSALREAMVEHNVFRGKVISLTPMGSVTFPTIPNVERDQVVLADGTLERLEQHAISISEHADELRAARRHLKRGVLLHGPPGTGKTLTVNYLLSTTEGRTTVLLTGQALGQISAAFSIARELAPATIVLEDVDLVAAERTMPGMHGGVLFELLNQLEGLAEDSDLLVVLTTNRPDLIEPALAARPGRVDLALELPLPDDDGRRRLLRLYSGQIELDQQAERHLVERSEGATGALIKELMRQATLRAAVNGTAPTSADVVSILDELLEERAALTRRLLGQPPGGDGPPTPPPEAMTRAFVAARLPMPHSAHQGPYAPP
jgi:DNA polymerase III delta prime subunit